MNEHELKLEWARHQLNALNFPQYMSIDDAAELVAPHLGVFDGRVAAANEDGTERFRGDGRQRVPLPFAHLLQELQQKDARLRW